MRRSKTKKIDNGRDRDFYWLLKNLIPNPDNPKEKMIKGCQVFVPDTVFFKMDGSIDCFIQNDKDGSLSYFIEQKKMFWNYLRKKLEKIVDERQNNKEMFWCYKDL